jgi:hypothetical protein
MTKKLQEIEVTVLPGGGVKIDAKGFVGDECLKETASLEEALGKLEVKREMKPEASKKVSTPSKATVGRGS